MRVRNMNEQTIFQGSQPPPQPPAGENLPVQNVAPPVSTGNILPTTPTESSFPIRGNLIKLIIGVFIIVIAGFFILRFIASSKPSTPENVTLTYWGLWEDENALKPVITEFEKQNPNIKIVYEKQKIKEYRERVFVRSEKGSGPDIFRFHNTWLPMLSNLLLPMPNDVISKEDFQKIYYPVVQKDLVKNGAILGLPLQIDTLALFINMDILKAAGLDAPVNWVDFQNAATIMTTEDETGKIQTAGVAMGTYDNITHASDIISLLLLQNSADLKDISKAPQNAIDALDFYTSFSKGNGNKTVWNKDMDESILAFAKGSLAMYFGYSWDIFTIESFRRVYNSDFSYEIFPVPHLPSPATPLTIASYWAEGVSTKSKHQKEALMFLKFLTQKETQQKLFTEESKTRLFGEPYARMDLADSLKSNRTLYPFVSQGADASSSFFASSTYDNGLNDKTNEYLKKAVDSISNNTSTQTAVDTLSKGVSQVLKEYGM